jgi:hypothetical protein
MKKLNSKPVEKLKKVSITSAKTAEPKKKGGARPGAGMPKGKMTAKVLERMKVKAEYNQRVLKHVDELFTAQLANAKGNTYIYEVVEIDIGGGKTRKKHELITDPVKITQVLDENQGNSGEVEGGYFIVTTEKPDNIAIKDMLDRTFGPATQSLELSGPDGKPIQTHSTISQLDSQKLKNLDPEKLLALKKAVDIQNELLSNS